MSILIEFTVLKFRIRISSSINLKRDEKYGENMRRVKEHANNKNNNKKQNFIFVRIPLSWKTVRKSLLNFAFSPTFRLFSEYI